MEKEPPYLISRLFAQYRIKARERNLDFEITLEDFKKLIKQNCYLCGDPPSIRQRVNRGKHFEISIHGVDRRQNELGYIPGNIVACCHTCNRIKSDFGLAFLKQHIAKMMKKVAND